MLEKIIAGIIVIVAIYFLYKNFKKKSSGQCNCGSCSSHCPLYEDKKKK